MTRFTEKQVDDLNSKIKTTEDALEWVSDNLHPKVAKASSFGAEDAVVMDIMLKINPKFRFFTLDTGRLPQATYDIIDTVTKKYNISIEILFPDTKQVEDMVKEKGVNLFYESVENRKLCCEVRKVHLNEQDVEYFGWLDYGTKT